MNTSTMRLDQYLHDNEEHFHQISTFVQSVVAKEDHIHLVSLWLRQHFSGVYDHLDQREVEWEELARRFILEFAPIADENLPRLVVVLVDASYWLEEECNEQKAYFRDRCKICGSGYRGLEAAMAGCAFPLVFRFPASLSPGPSTISALWAPGSL